MRRYKEITTAFLLLIHAFTLTLNAQQIIPVPEASKIYPVNNNDAAHPCITPGEYAFIEQEIEQNCRLLHLDNNVPNRVLSTSLSWPLKAAAGFTNCSYYAITAHVDQDPAATAYKDYNCGSIAYDTHTGTDIAIFPFGFYMMDNNQVEVIAAAPGTIIARADGNFDRNCSANNLPANYIIIRHPDGSTALYWHMKKNSVTSKIVGQTVVAGEYLGVVGSSGSASGPHLHFEVWSGSTAGTVIDPFYASCNILNGSTWWASQKAYTEPSVLKASVHTTDVVFPDCPTTETPNESTSYTLPFQGAGLPANAAKFYIFLRNETPGLVANLSILNPNNTVFTSWSVTSSTTHISSYWGWTKTLPSTAGTYTFKAVYNGITCSQTFDILTAAVASISASGPTTFCQGDSVILTASAGASYLWSNGKTTRSITVKTSGSYTVKVTYQDASSSTSPATVVTVNSLPTATISTSGSTTFCQGDSVILTSSTGSSYLWSNASTSKSITVKSTGNYSVKVTGANGCSAISTITSITVNSLPTATISTSGSTTFCQGDSVTLTSSSGSSYLWSNASTSKSITVKSTGSYSVKVTGANGCSATSTITSVTVNSLPTATISTSGSTTFCQGDSVILTSSSGSSYLWSNSSTSKSITVKSPGSYSVKVTGANGCSATSTITAVTVNSLPIATISTSGSTTFCQGDSVILTSSSGSSYLWSNASTSKSITVKLTGNYSVKVTGANGCSATSTIKAVSVNAPQNGLSVLLRNDTLFTPYNAKNYWNLVGNPLPFDSGLYYKCRQTGIYFASGRDVNGCLAKSANASINCDITAIPYRSDVSLLNVYPNPVNNILTIDWSNTENGAYSMVLINELGQIMLEKKDIVLHRSLYMTLSTADLPDGIYFLVIESEKVRKTIKVNKLSQ